MIGFNKLGRTLRGRVLLVVTGVSMATMSLNALVAPSAGAASAAPGVTATAIKVGIPYVDIAAVDKQIGLHINQGSYPDSYNALIKSINSRGGINGRKIVPIFVPVNPTGTAAAATACTQLTEDTPVFVSIDPLSPECYLNHKTPTINSTVTQVLSSGAAENFTLTPPAVAYDPIQIATLAKQGVFKGKRVAVFGGETTDQDEVKVVQTALAKNRVKVVQTAIDSAPATDQVAGAQQEQAISQRFKNAGINLVVAVGTGSSAWPQYQEQNQSTYTPPWVATNAEDLLGTMQGKTFDTQYVSNVVSTSPTPNQAAIWLEPQIKSCVSTIKKAYPSNVINSPIGQTPGDSSTNTYVAPENACINLGLFTAIVKAAGKSLTVKSFNQAGYGLKNVTLPGAGAPVSFGPGQAYALGPVYMAKYDPVGKTLAIAAKPVNK